MADRLDPLPPNATPEQREQRIAELRTRRKARRRKLAVRSGIGIGVLSVLVLFILWWLLGSLGGRDFLLQQVQSRLPEGTELHWSRAEGPVRGPMVLHDVRFISRGCPARDEQPVDYPNCEFPRVTTFTAKVVAIDPKLLPLLGKKLQLDELAVREASLDLPDSDEPFKLPTWPDALPQVAPPLALQADAIEVDNLRITRVGAPVIDLRSVRGGLEAGDGQVHVEKLQVDSDLGRFAVHGDYAPADNYRTDLQATAVFPVTPGLSPLQRTPARIGLVAKGDLSNFDIGIGGSVPKPLRAAIHIGGDRENPTWTMRSNIDGLDPAALSGQPPSPQLITARLQAAGVGGNAKLQGEFKQGDLVARIQPSQLQLQDQVLAFEPLVVDVFDGRIVVRGRGDFRAGAQDAKLQYTVVADKLRFGGSSATPGEPPSPVIGADARLGIAGTQAAWAVIGKATVSRDGERANIQLDGRGNQDRLTLKSLGAQMPSGRLDATGAIGWTPRINWALDAQLAGFDPGYFASDWPGAVNATIATSGSAREDAGFDAKATITDIGGRLRKRALSGNAKVDIQGERYVGDLLLGVGDGRLQGKGEATIGKTMQWKADATLRGFDPGLVLADWPGAVDAVLASVGSTDADGNLQTGVDLRNLGGNLRGRKLDGHAKVGIAMPRQGSARFNGDIAVGMGSSRLTAKGDVSDRLAVDAQLTPVHLDDFLPGSGGTLQGTLKLGGARTAPDIDADLTGSALHYQDYKAQTLSVRGRLPWRGDGGNLSVQATAVAAGVALDSLQLQARGAVEHLQLEGQAQGQDLGAVQLAGNMRRQGDRWNGALAQLQFKPARGASWQLQAPAQFGLRGDHFTLANSCFNSSAGGSLCAQADWPRNGITLDGSALPLALATPYMPLRDDGRPWALNGNIDLSARLRPTGNHWTGNAQVRSSAGGVRNSERARRDLFGYRDLRLDAEFNPQRVQATLATGLLNGGHINARATTGWDGAAPLAGELDFDVRSLVWLELFSPDIVDPTGVLAGDLRFGGTLGAPTIGGQARLTGFATEVPMLNIALTNGDIRMDAQPDGSARISGGVRSGDGVLNVDGSLNWRNGDTPLVLNLTGKNVLASDTRDIHAVIDPDLTVRYQAGQPMQVNGTVTIPEANLQLEHLGGSVAASSDVVVLDPAEPEETPSSPLAMDLTLAMGNDVHLAGFGLKGRLGGKLRVRAVPGREMTGSGGLDIEGRYKAYGQDLQITKGGLLWSNSPISDPLLDIKAERTIGEVIAGITVTGRASSPEARVYSNQGGSQSDALAYLTLGRPLSSLSSDESNQVGAASAALTAGGGMLASQLGSRIGLDDAGVMQSRTAGSVFGVGKYLSPRVYVGYGVSLLGTGQVMMLKYLLRRGFDIQIESSSVENRGSINWRKEK